MTNAHSTKALATLSTLGTEPGDWQLTPIEWVKEIRTVVGDVRCPTCEGHKFVVFVEGKVQPRPTSPDSKSSQLYGTEDYAAYRTALEAVRAYDAEAHKQANATMNRYGNCPTCPRRTRGYYMPFGFVKGPVKREVEVGYPKFPEGVRFDSRFAAGMHCHLCNKTILKSGRVPVHAVRDGKVHGMWVGEDCARKFLSVTIKRKKDSIMEG